MPALCDVNVLLALSYNGHIHHPQALAWLDKQADFGVGLCRHTQLGLLRLLSNPTVMGPDVCNLGQAWSIYDLILQDVRFIFSIEPEGLEPFLRQYSHLKCIFTERFYRVDFLKQWQFSRADKSSDSESSQAPPQV